MDNKRIRPYKNRKQAIKRERIIMLASSAVVMAALTMTGIYMKEKNLQEQDNGNGYSIDLAEMEANVNDKYAELVEEVEPQIQVADNSVVEEIPVIEDAPSMIDEELDYMPREDSIVDFPEIEVEVGSGMVEIPGLTDIVEEVPIEEALPMLEQEYTFTEEEGLIVPIMNDILMHFDMDHTVYFATLDQYKYNPAVIFCANEGSEVFACADGMVVDIYQNEEIGQALVLDLGNGYLATYGQLKDVKVSVGDSVVAGQSLANVGAPTKYYSAEGYNLYFSLTKDGVAINPEEMM